MNLSHCKTIAQFKIMSWLAVQGITPDDISRVDLRSDNRLRVINPFGQYMDLIYNDGMVRISKLPEEGEQNV